jgi:hypothetical protein
LRIRASLALVALLLGSSLVLTSPGPAAAAEMCFSETGQCLKDAFLNYWQNRGGLELLGFPISGEFVEVSPTDGKPYTVQYTERTRLERHPENAPPYNVLAGLLGREQYLAKYGGGTWGPTLAPLAGGKNYNEPNGYFTFSVPLNWTQAADPGAYRVLFAAPGNVASVGILAEAAPAGYTLDQLDQFMLALVQAEPGYAAVLHDKVTVHGLRAYRHIYTRTLGGAPIGVELVYLLGPGDKVAYAVQLGTTVAAFPTLQPTFDAIAGSFQAHK